MRRALTNSLPWPSWPVALAPDYTLFLPVSHRSTNIYGSPTGTQPVAAIENNEIDIADREVEANGIAMNPLHSQRRETRADSEESLDVEVGSGLAPIVIRSRTAGAERSTRRGPRPPQTYVALSASDDSNTINDDRSSY